MNTNKKAARLRNRAAGLLRAYTTITALLYSTQIKPSIKKRRNSHE